MFLQLIKSSGIILSYAWLLIAISFLDWEPILFFLSIYLELISLFVVYCIIRIRDEQLRPAFYRKRQPLLNVFIGIIPLLLFHLAIIALLASSFDSEIVFFGKQNFLFSPTFFILFAIISINYIIQAFQIKQSESRVALFQENFLFKALLLTIINLIGFLVIRENSSYIPVLIALMLARDFIEWRFSKRMQLI